MAQPVRTQSSAKRPFSLFSFGNEAMSPRQVSFLQFAERQRPLGWCIAFFFIFLSFS